MWYGSKYQSFNNYGYVTKEGEENVFVHFSVIEMDGFKEIDEAE